MLDLIMSGSSANYFAARNISQAHLYRGCVLKTRVLLRLYSLRRISPGRYAGEAFKGPKGGQGKRLLQPRDRVSTLPPGYFYKTGATLLRERVS